LERLELFALPAAERLPILNEVGIKTVINGPIPVSADGEPIMGLAPELDNFYVACGFTAGIAASGGAGVAMAGWILDGDPGMDLWSFDVRRFGAVQAQGRYLEARAIEAYAAYYKIHFPGEETHAARGLRRSPLYERLTSAGAVYGSKNGWERPLWFAPEGVEAKDQLSFEEKPGWLAHVAEEHRAIRERVALIDQSSFSKLGIAGPGALAALQRIAANDIDVAVGRSIYTQLLNDKGGIEADVTIIRAGDSFFYLVTGSGFGVRDRHWVETHLPRDGSVLVSEATNGFATINLCGPRARDVLAAVSDDDVSNESFPFLSARWLEIGNARAFATRIGYVGELGYELYVPTEYAPHVYEALWEAGQPHGIANAGYRAIESCRLEKGYLYWSGDISPDTNPFEAGLGFAVALNKGDFLGREALIRIRQEGAKRRLASFTVEGFAPFHSGETILHGGHVVGQTTSAGFGHTLQRTIAFGYVPAGLERETEFTIEAFGRSYRATKGPRCLYDPKGSRLRS
jgi:4-methylaminobutanoate oxidase (formaldehyde-forming)